MADLGRLHQDSLYEKPVVVVVRESTATTNDNANASNESISLSLTTMGTVIRVNRIRSSNFHKEAIMFSKLLTSHRVNLYKREPTRAVKGRLLDATNSES